MTGGHGGEQRRPAGGFRTNDASHTGAQILIASPAMRCRNRTARTRKNLFVMLDTAIAALKTGGNTEKEKPPPPLIKPIAA
ncbi:hypothetical protein KCP74_20740 [Salmonella enterica subsp. enterica]|nr:hypothetical protein KCP74_20740 [Salmonella enterica subsp. enterica]